MKKNLNKALKSLLAITLAISTLFTISPIVNVEAKEVDYEIYPVPHEMNYNDGNYIIRSQVNVVYENGIDDATKNRLTEVLQSKNKEISISDKKVNGKTNVFVGTYQSGGYVDSYVAKNYKIEKSLFDKFGAHFVASNNGEIVILGTDTDGAFYGITSLKHIFNQMEGSTIRNFEIKDYADTNIRGFIEGYYGIPWSNEDRINLMRFGGDIKMTSYIFAPKNDPYHKEKWREPYPTDELERLKEMVNVGNETKCRFVWTAHPFMGGFNQANYKAEIETLIAKFEHLYNDANVRQFGILGDDVGNLPRSIVIEMMKAVSDWAKEKGDVYETVFCPGGYNHSWQGDYSELNEYDAGFPDDINIFWTGEAVCKPIEQKTLDHFRNQNAVNGQRRAPLFWLNWPVNDINHSRMLMGEGTKLLQNNINVEDLAGAVTNPMQESEPSKVAIFQLANFSWNVKGFDGHQTWVDAFKYVDADAADELYTLAKHMANPEPNGHGLVMPESVEIAPKLAAFKKSLAADSLTKEDIEGMINEFNIIVDACDGFNAKSKNTEMKNDLKPFIASLKDLAQATVKFLEAKRELDDHQMQNAFNAYIEGETLLKASATHKKPTLGGGEEIVDPGSTELIPFAQYLQTALSGPINDYVAGGDNVKLEITASSSFNSFYEGKIENIIDGKNDTFAWHGSSEAVGQYYQVNFNIPQTIYGVHILNGTKNKLDDTFGTGEVKYQVEGSNEWKSLGEFKNYPSAVDVDNIEVEKVVAVRYECKATGAGGKWPSMREFKVSLEPETDAFTKDEVIITPNHWGYYSGTAANIIDDNLNTNVHFKVRNNNSYGDKKDTYISGDYVGIKLSKPITLGKIEIHQGKSDNDGDYFNQSKLQYSLDGKNWTDIPGATELTERNIVFDASDLNIKAQYVRLVARNSRNVWVGMREFDVDAKIVFNSKAYTNVDSLKKLGANVRVDDFELGAINNITLQPNEYIGLKLDRIHEINDIDVDITTNELTLEAGKNEYQFETVDNSKLPVDARYIRLINKTKNAVTFNINKFRATSNEIYSKSYLNDSTFPVQNNALLAFDGDWTSETVYAASQHKGNYFIYDLGQEVEISKFKVVCHDSEHDFPRHGKFSVATTLDGNWTTIMNLGNQDSENPGEAENKDEIGFVLPDHEISYNTKTEKIEQPLTARYLKFEITRTKTGSDKWVRFSEIIINDGEYIPVVNDPTYESTGNDTLGGEFDKLTDGNLSTYFIPDKDGGSFTYYVSDKNDKNIIKIIQSATAISNAEVKATVLNEGGTGDKTITLGKLSQTVNEFILPADTTLSSITLNWDKIVPNFAELILNKTTNVPIVDKSALKTLLDNKIDTTQWTKQSKDGYDKAISSGIKVNEGAYVSQETVNSAASAIQSAIDAKELKGDITKLQEKLNNKITDESLYTVKSWRVYQNTIAKMENAIKQAENTSENDVVSLLEEYELSLSKLAYSPLKAEEATIVVEEMNIFIQSVTAPNDTYTKASWETFIKAVESLSDKIKQNSETPVNPNEFDLFITKVNESKENLVSISELVVLVKEFDRVDGSLYTKDSYNAYKEAVNMAKTVCINGTKADVLNAKNAIETAKANLKTVINIAELEAYIKELKELEAKEYTEVSYANLTKAIEEVEALGKELTNKQIEEAMDKLTNAKNQLVNVVALKAAVQTANNYDAQKYTVDSYNKLLNALKPVNQLLKNGTKEEVSETIKAIETAILGLESRIDNQIVKDYLDKIKFIENADRYTKKSYKVYKDAYDYLVSLSKDLSNVSVGDFYDAVEAFENAEKNLIKVVEPEKVETGDNTNMILYMGICAMSLICLTYLFTKKRKENN